MCNGTHRWISAAYGSAIAFEVRNNEEGETFLRTKFKNGTFDDTFRTIHLFNRKDDIALNELIYRLDVRIITNNEWPKLTCILTARCHPRHRPMVQGMRPAQWTRLQSLRDPGICTVRRQGDDCRLWVLCFETSEQQELPDQFSRCVRRARAFRRLQACEKPQAPEIDGLWPATHECSSGIWLPIHGALGGVTEHVQLVLWWPG